jgi:hypothetical protein
MAGTEVVASGAGRITRAPSDVLRLAVAIRRDRHPVLPRPVPAVSCRALSAARNDSLTGLDLEEQSDLTGRTGPDAWTTRTPGSR